MLRARTYAYEMLLNHNMMASFYFQANTQHRRQILIAVILGCLCGTLEVGMRMRNTQTGTFINTLRGCAFVCRIMGKNELDVLINEAICVDSRKYLHPDWLATLMVTFIGTSCEMVGCNLGGTTP